jgi:hypothetical protein
VILFTSVGNRLVLGVITNRLRVLQAVRTISIDIRRLACSGRFRVDLYHEGLALSRLVSTFYRAVGTVEHRDEGGGERRDLQHLEEKA